jgi:hypothetical protein
VMSFVVIFFSSSLLLGGSILVCPHAEFNLEPVEPSSVVRRTFPFFLLGELVSENCDEDVIFPFFVLLRCNPCSIVACGALVAVTRWEFWPSLPKLFVLRASHTAKSLPRSVLKA